jgi:hypothetical protein
MSSHATSLRSRRFDARMYRSMSKSIGLLVWLMTLQVSSLNLPPTQSLGARFTSAARRRGRLYAGAVKRPVVREVR